MSMQSLLAHHIRIHGPIATARVSSAQAKGAAKKYAYWGAVRYQIRLRANGTPINVALERARSDRRSYRLAEQDLARLCESEGREVCKTIGAIGEAAAASWLPGEYADAVARYHARRVNRVEDQLIVASRSRKDRLAELRAAALRAAGYYVEQLRFCREWIVRSSDLPYEYRAKSLPTLADCAAHFARKYAIGCPARAARQYLGLTDDCPREIAVDAALDRGDAELANSIQIHDSHQ